jgi:hypothetical protein
MKHALTLCIALLAGCAARKEPPAIISIWKLPTILDGGTVTMTGHLFAEGSANSPDDYRIMLKVESASEQRKDGVMLATNLLDGTEVEVVFIGSYEGALVEQALGKRVSITGRIQKPKDGTGRPQLQALIGTEVDVIDLKTKRGDEGPLTRAIGRHTTITGMLYPAPT